MVFVPTAGLSLPRSAQGAVLFALDEVRHPDKSYAGLCDHFVGRCYGYPHSGFDDAREHWNAIPDRYKRKPGTPAPKGSLHFWRVGAHDHVAIDVGPGIVASNDIIVRGRISVVKVSRITEDWNAKYLGHARPWFRP
jgi:hypothetical protein